MAIETKQPVDHMKTHWQVYSLLALILAMNAQVVWEMVGDWVSDDSHSHGFLIIPISIYLFWRQRDKLNSPRDKTGWGWIVLLAGGGGLVLGTAASEFFTTRLSIVLMVSGLTMIYLGTSNFRKVWFPFFFLLFMIPIPAVIYNSLTLPLQLLASKISISGLQLIGVPCSRAGNIINLPGHSLEVADACSGLRSLTSLLALAAVWGHLSLPKAYSQILLVAGAVPIAIVINAARVFVVSVGVYSIDKGFAEGFLHDLAGMTVFLGAMVATLGLGVILKWTGSRS